MTISRFALRLLLGQARLLLIFNLGVEGYHQVGQPNTGCNKKILPIPCNKANDPQYVPPLQPANSVAPHYLQPVQLVTPVLYKPMPMKPYRRPSPLLTYIKFLLLQKLFAAGVTLPTISAPSPTKPTKWWADPYHCKYHYQPTSMRYHEAVAYCGRIGGKLAAGLWRSHFYFEEDLASKIILDLLPRMLPKTALWVGVRYVAGDVDAWVYSDGVVIGEDRVEDLDCKIVFTVDDGFEVSFDYVDETCEGKHSFVCEDC